MGTAVGSAGLGDQDFAVREATTEQVGGFWWLWLVTGCLWVVAALVILQFDQASVATVGILVGLMFAAAAVQQFVAALVVERYKALWIVFGSVFAVASIVCFVNPKNTFAGMA